jgi:hypothetical protein
VRFFLKYTVLGRNKKAVHTLTTFLGDMNNNVALKNTVNVFMLRTKRLQFTMKLVLSKWAYRRSVLMGQVRSVLSPPPLDANPRTTYSE